MNLVQREAAGVVRRVNDRNFCGIRAENTAELASLKLPNPQEFKRIEMASFDQGIEIIIGERGGIHKIQSSSRSPKAKPENKNSFGGNGRIPAWFS